jgi:hypothetical protein
MQSIGKMLIFLGLGMVVLGVLLFLSGKLPFFGKLPGDIIIRKKNFTLYIPLATCLLLSFLLTIFLYIFRKK